MARKADTQSLTDHLLPLRLHSAGRTQFLDISQPTQTLPALVRLRRTESAGVWAQPTPRRSRNHRRLTYLGTKARLPSPSSLHCHRRSIKSGWQRVALAQTAQVPLSRCERLPRYSEASSWPGYAQMLDAGELHLPDSELKIPVNRARWFSLLYTKRWVLYAKRPFGGPQQVLSYLANYTHRVALSNRRIVAVDAQHQSVTFTYRDYRHGSQRKELTLSALEFIRRFSLHILPPGLVRIRHYGILGNNRRKRDIEAARLIFISRGRAVELQPRSVADPTLAECVVHRAEKPEFVWWPLPMPPPFCT